MEKVEIEAIHEYDLKKQLKKFKLWKSLKNGEIKCFHCKEIITLDNLLAFKPINGRIELICNKCLLNL